MDEIIGLVKLIGLPFITGAIGYVVGRQKKIDELLIAEAVPRSEQVSLLIQEIYNEDMAMIEIWNNNFGHFDNSQEAINYFEEREIYSTYRDRILELSNKRQQLSDLIRSSRIYLNHKTLNMVDNYLSISKFSYHDDGMNGALYTEFWREFFINILDKKKISTRNEIYNKIKNRLSKLYNK